MTHKPAPAIPKPGEGKRGPEGYLGYLLRQAAVATRTAMDRALADQGLTSPQFAVLALTFFIVLTLAGGQDVIAQVAHVSITSVTRTLRIMVVVAPLVAAAITWKWCHRVFSAETRARRANTGRYKRYRTPVSMFMSTCAV